MGVEKGDLEMCEILIENGADVNSEDMWGTKCI